MLRSRANGLSSEYISKPEYTLSESTKVSQSTKGSQSVKKDKIRVLLWTRGKGARAVLELVPGEELESEPEL